MTATAEQQARDMLERLGMPDAQSLSAGDVVELANLIDSSKPPTGWKLVPIEPTEKMIAAGDGAMSAASTHVQSKLLWIGYQAMLSALAVPAGKVD